tara:strand:- start:5639 stop:6208 length:570 start_codon:yes stop_codon:yes gene_type:complete
MEDKNKLILFLIFMTTHQFITGDQIKNEFASQLPSSDQEYSRNVSPEIILDSVVIDNRNKNITSLSGVKSIGHFLYEVKPNQLANFIDKQARSDSNIISKKESNFRLVSLPGKDFLISDGSFVVFFKDPSDKQQFNTDYQLQPKYEMPDANSYKTDDFKSLSALLDILKNDERVQLVELDLIDPYIVLQ